MLPKAVVPRTQRQLRAWIRVEQALDCCRASGLRPMLQACSAWPVVISAGVSLGRPVKHCAEDGLRRAGCLRRSEMSLSVAGPIWWTNAVALRVQGPLRACIRVAQALSCCQESGPCPSLACCRASELCPSSAYCRRAPPGRLSSPPGCRWADRRNTVPKMVSTGPVVSAAVKCH